MSQTRRTRSFFFPNGRQPVLLAVFFGFGVCLIQAGEQARSPVVVKIQDENATVVEGGTSGPLDPAVRVHIEPPPQQLNINVKGEQKQTLHLSHFPSFKIDNNFYSPFNGLGGGRFETMNARLPKTANGKDRVGFLNVYILGDLRITQTIEIAPTKPAASGQKRLLDSVLVRYTLENKGKQSHKIGVRTYMDTYIVDNDGCLFAAPTMPGKVLDGVELKDKTVPDYFQLLQRPDLKNPGYVAHMTLNLGSAYEKPDRVVFTRHGNGLNTWEMLPAVAGGDSAMGVFWEPRDVKPGEKREIAYGYGKGIVVAPENEGRFNLVLGGSFEPGKLFTVSAYVADPAPGQTLTIELPPGMERVEGKEIQPVYPASEERPQGLVLWKARVLQPGQFPLRVRSSTGVTQTKTISISLAESRAATR